MDAVAMQIAPSSCHVHAAVVCSRGGKLARRERARVLARGVSDDARALHVLIADGSETFVCSNFMRRMAEGCALLLRLTLAYIALSKT